MWVPCRLLLLSSLVAGCGGARVGGSASLSVNDDLVDPTALAGCSAGDARANLEIISDLRDSYHEMIVCGGLSLDFNQSIVNVIANAVLHRGGASALRYQGNGTYASGNGMMLIKVAMPSANGPVAFDVLDPQSYLVGLQVDASGALNIGAAGGSPWKMVTHAAGQLRVSFQGEGPGFALLGVTANDIRTGHFSLKDIATSIGDHLTVANRIDVQNQQGGTTIHYLLDGAPQPLSGALGSKSVPMTLASIVATHEATGQTIRVTDWTMQFKGDGSRVLDGTIGLEVDGGAFPYTVKFTYPHRAEPDIELRCR